jgi:glucuronate isomerase
LLIHPDHYVFRMLYSQGVTLESLRIGNAQGDPRESWRLLASRYHLFRGTPSRIWLDCGFAESFGIDVQLEAETSDHYFDHITAMLATDAFRPRALFERCNIEVIATTESPVDDLRHHRAFRESGGQRRVISAYRPDPVVDPEFEGFRGNLALLSELTGEDAFGWQDYLAPHRKRRAYLGYSADMNSYIRQLPIQK